MWDSITLNAMDWCTPSATTSIRKNFPSPIFTKHFPRGERAHKSTVTHPTSCHPIELPLMTYTTSGSVQQHSLPMEMSVLVKRPGQDTGQPWHRSKILTLSSGQTKQNVNYQCFVIFSSWPLDNAVQPSKLWIMAVRWNLTIEIQGCSKICCVSRIIKRTNQGYNRIDKG